jgi:chromosome segregation ATPase
MTVQLDKLFEVDGQLNEKMVTMILEEIKGKHEVGMDYLKFKQAVLNLMDLQQDASTMGMDKTKLLSSIQSYKNVIDKERDKFIATLKGQITANIEKPKADIDRIDSEIKENTEKIAQLEQQIVLYKQKQQELANQILNAESKIEDTRAQFLAVYEAFIKNLDDDSTRFSALV